MAACRCPSMSASVCGGHEAVGDEHVLEPCRRGQPGAVAGVLVEDGRLRVGVGDAAAAGGLSAGHDLLGRHRLPDDAALVGRHLADVRVLAEAAGEVAAHRGQGVGGRCRAGSGRAASSRWGRRRWRPGSHRPGCRGRPHGSPVPRTCRRRRVLSGSGAHRESNGPAVPRATLPKASARTGSTGRSMGSPPQQLPHALAAKSRQYRQWLQCPIQDVFMQVQAFPDRSGGHQVDQVVRGWVGGRW